MNRAALVVIFSGALLAAPALAQTPPSGGRLFGTDEAPPPGLPPSAPRIVMRLDYIRAPGAEGCPDAQAFRDVAGTKIRGWDPFAPNAPNHLTITITRQAAGYAGTGELRDVTGAVLWRRPFPPTPRCADLLEDLAVSLALHVDPPLPPLPPTAVPIGPVLPFETWQPPPPPLPARTPAWFRFGLATWLDLAVAPRPAFAMTGYVGFRVAWFSLAGEVRWDPSAGSGVMEGVDLSITRIMGGLVPCGHVGKERVTFVGCLVAEAGQVRGVATTRMKLAPPDDQQAATVIVGARPGFEVVIAPHLSLSAAIDLLGAMKRPSFELGHKNGTMSMVWWESPAFTGGFSLGLVAFF